MGRIDKLSESQVKWLTYLVYILLFFLTAGTIWSINRVSEIEASLPEKYVQKDRYLCDQLKIEKKLDRILDYLEKP